MYEFPLQTGSAVSLMRFAVRSFCSKPSGSGAAKPPAGGAKAPKAAAGAQGKPAGNPKKGDKQKKAPAAPNAGAPNAGANQKKWFDTALDRRNRF